MAKAKSEGMKVLSTLMVAPGKLLLTEKFQGRSQPLSEEALIELADSIRVQGQQQAIQVRQVEGTDTYEVIFGNSRARAGQMIYDGYERDKQQKVAGNEDFKLRCEVVEVEDGEAFARNVIENEHRNPTTAIDKAKNIKHLMDEYDYTGAACARLFKINPGYVTKLCSLLTLPEYYQHQIHVGNWTSSAGITLASAKDVVEAEAYDAVHEHLKGEGTNVEGATVGQSDVETAIKAWRKAEAAKHAPPVDLGQLPATTPVDPGQLPATTPATKGFSMSLAAIRSNFTDWMNDERCPPTSAQVLKLTLDTINGESDKDAYMRKLMKILGEKLLEVAPKPQEDAAQVTTPKKKRKVERKS